MSLFTLRKDIQTLGGYRICNRADRNYWVYDERGRVVGVASAKVIERSIEKGYINEEEARRILEYLERRFRRR